MPQDPYPEIEEAEEMERKYAAPRGTLRIVNDFLGEKGFSLTKPEKQRRSFEYFDTENSSLAGRGLCLRKVRPEGDEWVRFDLKCGRGSGGERKEYSLRFANMAAADQQPLLAITERLLHASGVTPFERESLTCIARFDVESEKSYATSSDGHTRLELSLDSVLCTEPRLSLFRELEVELCPGDAMSCEGRRSAFSCLLDELEQNPAISRQYDTKLDRMRTLQPKCDALAVLMEGARRGTIDKTTFAECLNALPPEGDVARLIETLVTAWDASHQSAEESISADNDPRPTDWLQALALPEADPLRRWKQVRALWRCLPKMSASAENAKTRERSSSRDAIMTEMLAVLAARDEVPEKEVPLDLRVAGLTGFLRTSPWPDNETIKRYLAALANASDPILRTLQAILESWQRACEPVAQPATPATSVENQDRPWLAPLAQALAPHINASSEANGHAGAILEALADPTLKKTTRTDLCHILTDLDSLATSAQNWLSSQRASQPAKSPFTQREKEAAATNWEWAVHLRRLRIAIHQLSSVFDQSCGPLSNPMENKEVRQSLLGNCNQLAQNSARLLDDTSAGRGHQDALEFIAGHLQEVASLRGNGTRKQDYLPEFRELHARVSRPLFLAPKSPLSAGIWAEWAAKTSPTRRELWMDFLALEAITTAARKRVADASAHERPAEQVGQTQPRSGGNRTYYGNSTDFIGAAKVAIALGQAARNDWPSEEPRRLIPEQSSGMFELALVLLTRAGELTLQEANRYEYRQLEILARRAQCLIELNRFSDAVECSESLSRDKASHQQIRAYAYLGWAGEAITEEDWKERLGKARDHAARAAQLDQQRGGLLGLMVVPLIERAAGNAQAEAKAWKEVATAAYSSSREAYPLFLASRFFWSQPKVSVKESVTREDLINWLSASLEVEPGRSNTRALLEEIQASLAQAAQQDRAGPAVLPERQSLKSRLESVSNSRVAGENGNAASHREEALEDLKDYLEGVDGLPDEDIAAALTELCRIGDWPTFQQWYEKSRWATRSRSRVRKVEKYLLTGILDDALWALGDEGPSLDALRFAEKVARSLLLKENRRVEYWSQQWVALARVTPRDCWRKDIDRLFNLGAVTEKAKSVLRTLTQGGIVVDAAVSWLEVAGAQEGWTTEAADLRGRQALLMRVSHCANPLDGLADAVRAENASTGSVQNGGTGSAGEVGAGGARDGADGPQATGDDSQRAETVESLKKLAQASKSLAAHVALGVELDYIVRAAGELMKKEPGQTQAIPYPPRKEHAPLMSEWPTIIATAFAGTRELEVIEQLIRLRRHDEKPKAASDPNELVRSGWRYTESNREIIGDTKGTRAQRLRKLVNSLKDTIQRSTTLSVELVESGNPCVFPAPEFLVRHILTNLAANAKAAHATKLIFEVNYDDKSLAATDDGVGFSSEARGRVSELGFTVTGRHRPVSPSQEYTKGQQRGLSALLALVKSKGGRGEVCCGTNKRIVFSFPNPRTGG